MKPQHLDSMTKTILDINKEAIHILVKRWQHQGCCMTTFTHAKRMNESVEKNDCGQKAQNTVTLQKYLIYKLNSCGQC